MSSKHPSILAAGLAPTATASGQTFKSLIGDSSTGLVHFVNASVIPLLYAIAFLLFLFGIFRYFFTPSEEARAKGKQFAIWGIVGFVILFSVWGLVSVLLSVLTGGV